jgi:hypothetical protein
MISADKVLERWPAIHGDEQELAKLIDYTGDPFAPDGIPVAYHVHKVLKDGAENIISECTTCEPNKGEKYYSPYRTHYQGDDVLYDFSDIAFKLAEIVAYEKERPKLFYSVVSNPDEAWSISPQDTSKKPEYISAEELREEIGLSPVRFVEYLRERHRELPLFGLTRDDMNFFYDNYTRLTEATALLDAITIHRLDWEAFRKSEQERDAAMSHDSDSVAGGTQPAEVQKQIESLQRWNKRLNEQNKELLKTTQEKDARIAELEVRLTDNEQKFVDIEVNMTPGEISEIEELSNKLGVSPSEIMIKCAKEAVPLFMEHPELIHVADNIIKDKNKIAELEAELLKASAERAVTMRTQAATEARQGRTLENWRAAFKIMISVILQCHAEGTKKRTKRELQAMCSKHGGKLSDTQLDFLRDVLGKDHVNTTGGPTVQG